METEIKQKMMKMDPICVCCFCCARFIRLCGAFPMFPKHYLHPFGWLPPVCQNTPKHQVQKSHPFSQDRPVSKCRLSLPGPNLPMHFSSFPPCPSPVEK